MGTATEYAEFPPLEFSAPSRFIEISVPVLVLGR